MLAEEREVKRTREIEEWTNLYFIHPVSRRLVDLFVRLEVHPNAVSVGGMLLGAAAALAYYQYDLWYMALTGFLLMVGWHILDGVDGQLARLTGKTSETGKILDGLCDHVAFALVYLSLTLAMVPVIGPAVWALAALAGISHVIQAGAYEFQRQSYDYWVHGKESARLVMPDEFKRDLEQLHGARRLFGYLYLTYLRMQHQIAVADAELVTEMSRTTARHSAGREAYRAINLHPVRRWSLLCSNYRTAAIFGACLAGSPVYFFLFEIVVLNVAFVWLRAMQHRRNRRLVSWLQGSGEPVPYPIPLKPV